MSDRSFIGNWIKLNPDLQPHQIGYEDILKSPNSGALGSVKSAPVLPPLQENTAYELRERVLSSQRLQNAFELLSVSLKCCRSDIVSIGESEYDSMAANLSPLAVRSLFFLVAPIVNRLFSHVYVNVKALDKIRNAMQHHPVVLLPSHKSYLDFILLDIALYICDMPLPTIAAATDFSSMKLVGEWLRRCGAFFVQRGSGQAANLVTKPLNDHEDDLDKGIVRPLLVVNAEDAKKADHWKYIAADYLHRSILAEYVHQLVVYGHHRFLEFFIEGKRSRTGKACPPKRGLLNSIAEAYLHGDVDEIYLCPVSICYDRFLEESLYGRELLGTPKPKESTSGLFQSLNTILQNNYGSVVFTFGEPISLRDKANASGQIERSLHALHPAWIGALTNGERKFLGDLSLHIIDMHHQLTSVPVFSLTASCLTANVVAECSDDNISATTMPLSALVERVGWLCSALSAAHRALSLSLSHSLEYTILEVLRIHSNILTFSREYDTVSVKDDDDNGTLSLVQLSVYRNQSMFAIFPIAAVATCLSNCNVKNLNSEQLFELYAFLAKSLCYEFVSSENFGNKRILRDAFDRCISFMIEMQLIFVTDSSNFDVERSLKNPNNAFLACLLTPFVYGYALTSSFMLLRSSAPAIFLRNSENVAVLDKLLSSPAKSVLSKVAELVQSGSLPALARWSVSSDLLGNALYNFYDQKLMARPVRPSKVPSVNNQKMEEHRDRLLSYLPKHYQSSVYMLPQMIFFNFSETSDNSIHSKL